MKTIATVLIAALFTLTSCNQEKKSDAIDEVKTITLEQTVGEFKQKTLTLDEGTYIFEIENMNVAHEVGFVLAPKGKTDEANHIKSAYVTAPVQTGTTSKTQEVTLTKGEYVYFCPLNPTPEYTLVVK